MSKTMLITGASGLLGGNLAYLFRDRYRVVVPDHIYPDAGDLSVTLAPSVIGNLEGAFRYMRDYDHRCWEQVLSRGVMASHFNQLRPRLEQGFSWPEPRLAVSS